jgi:choline kinase
MPVIILAAGRGGRLRPMGWTRPKCLLPIGEKTLLDQMIEAVSKADIARIVLVVGFQQEQIQAAVGGSGHAARVQYVINPEFANTNTIYSLYLAREYFDDGFWLINGDVMFEAGILTSLAAEPCAALAVEARECGEEEVKVIVDEDRRVRRIGKTLDPSACFGEFVGVARFDRVVALALKEALRSHIATTEGRRLFFEAAIDDLLAQHRIVATPLGSLRAVEIDTPEDYQRVVAEWTIR